MRRRRSLAALGSVVVLGITVVGGGLSRGGSARASAEGETGAGGSHAAPRVLQIYYTPPVLVRAGEPVRIPIDVVCATRSGTACPAQAALTVTDVHGQPVSVTAPARPGLQFDVTAPASQALPSGSLPFALGASAGSAGVALPAGGGSLRLYVTDRMPTVQLPAIPFGAVRRPATVLSLPWGSGPRRAGIVLGRESATMGPPSFDVDGHGRVYLLDAPQDRVAVFARGRLVRSSHLDLSAGIDLSLDGRGGVVVLDRAGRDALVHRLSGTGGLVSTVSLGSALPVQIRSVGSSAYAYLLPIDAWVKVPGRPGAPVGAPSIARQLGTGNGLLRTGTQSRVRVGTVVDGRVRRALELRSSRRFGDLSLVEPDGRGGYLVVVRVWRTEPKPADQYQFVHILRGKVVQSFGMGDGRFAQVSPLSKFRVGGDGDLYQLTSDPSGVRIVRYDLERGS